MASVAKVQLPDSSKSPTTKKTLQQLQQSPTPMKGVLTESCNNYQPRSPPNVPEFTIKNQWEDDMLNKYQDLFLFPLDKSVNDRTMILLVLAYQMNTIRCWCELGDGALAKVYYASSIVLGKYILTVSTSMYLIILKDKAVSLIGVNIY